MATVLTFTFQHSKTRGMPYLIRLAKRGEYREEDLGHTMRLYRALFDVANPLHLAPAISLATALVHDKKAEAMVNGQHVGMPMVRAVLLCFEQSWQVEDVRAFCWVALDRDRHVLPCRLASQKAVAIHHEHPASFSDQIKAALVRAETHWCPRLQAAPAPLITEREAQP